MFWPMHRINDNIPGYPCKYTGDVWILTDQKEYILILEAMTNQSSERTFLLTKIQHLMCNIATQEHLIHQQAELNRLKGDLQKSKEIKEQRIEAIKENEMYFVKAICNVFDVELKKSEESDRNNRLDYLKVLGRWQFVKDWAKMRADKEPFIKSLVEHLETDVIDRLI